MAKQSKKPADLNRLAAAIVGDATDDLTAKAPATKKKRRSGAAQKVAKGPRAKS